MWNEVAQDIVALDVDNGNCFGLQDVAAEVWRLLDTPQTPSSICEELQTQYDVDIQTCQQEIDRLLDEMVEQGLAEKLA